MRKVEEKDLVGKTIKSINSNADNVLKLVFDDGSELELWAETIVQTSYGNISGILIQD